MTKKSKHKTEEQDLASAKKFFDKRPFFLEQKTEPKRPGYKKQVQQISELINPQNVEQLIRSVQYTPEKYSKHVPAQLMTYQEGAKLLYYTLKHFVDLDGKDFVMSKNKESVYRMIAQYIILDPAFETENIGMHLNKGLFIYGKKGTGKTILFNALKLIFDKMNFHYHKFERTTCKRIVLQVDEKKKLSAINPYLQRQWMFDDLGHETNMISLYGNKANVMEEIMTERYNLYQDTGIKTHMTSNLQIKDPDEITELYGERVRDRFNQMFNFIYMGGESLRK